MEKQVDETDTKYSHEIVYGSDTKKEDTLWNYLEEWYSCITHWLLIILIVFGPFIFIFVVLYWKLWISGFAYLCWIYYDSETPHKGGRRMRLFRTMKLWEYRRDYFPTRLVKTTDLPPDTTYLFSCFPHGVVVFGVSNTFGSDIHHFEEAYPGLTSHIMTLNLIFKLPIFRDLILLFGTCAASERAIKYILNGKPGNVCVLVVGGVAEALKSLPGTNRLVVKNRKGFVRMALSSGSSLVPVFSFGETDTYDQPSAKWYWWLQSKIRSTTGLPFMLPIGRTFMLPHKSPITTVVGAPMKLPKIENPSQEIIDLYHKKFIDELILLFNKYKGKYDINGENAVLHIE